MNSAHKDVEMQTVIQFATAAGRFLRKIIRRLYCPSDLFICTAKSAFFVCTLHITCYIIGYHFTQHPSVPKDKGL